MFYFCACIMWHVTYTVNNKYENIEATAVRGMRIRVVAAQGGQDARMPTVQARGLGDRQRTEVGAGGEAACSGEERREMMDHPIPPMTHELSAYWQQPSREAILVDDTHALMTQATFEQLAEYSCSLPTGVYEGKMWRGHYKDGDWLHWFDTTPGDPTSCRRHNRKILIV